MEKKNIGKHLFFQSGYGRGGILVTIYEIDGKHYVKNYRIYRTDFNQLQGELTGYVRAKRIEGSDNFCQVKEF
jgi:hypothetical protein